MLPRVSIALVFAFAALSTSAQDAETSRFPGEGHTRDVLREIDGRAVGELQYVDAVVGKGFLFNGVDSAVAVPDAPGLRLTHSLALSAWVRADAYPSPEQGYAQLIFRGDDRGGLDPYFLGLNADGELVFGIDSGTAALDVRAPLPLAKFTHVVASLDDATGCMRLMYDGRVVAQTTTRVRPFRDLDPSAHPGVGIGNHASRPDGAWNQPFRGILDEVVISGETTLAPESVRLVARDERTLTATVTLAAPAPPGGADVELNVSADATRFPQRVHIPPGDSSASFEVGFPGPVPPVTVRARYHAVSREATYRPS